MRRLNTSLLALPFVLGTALAGCGDDGGGASAAYCDAAEEAADLDDDAAVDDRLEAFEDLADEAPGSLDDQFELVDELVQAVLDADVDALEDLDEDEVDEATSDIADFTEEECDVELDIDELEVPDASDFEEEDTGGDTGEDTGDDTGGDEGGSGEFDELVDACGSGDMGACDELFQVTPVGSPEEEFGATCGGIVPVEQAIPGECEAQFG